MRPIDAIKYGENLVWLVGHGEFSSPQDALRRALYDLAQTPTLPLDDLRPKGRWNIVEIDKAANRITIECTECGMVEETSLTAYGLNRDFCPSCGADMRGGGEK